MELISQTENLLNAVTGKLQVKALTEGFTFQIEEGYTNPLEFAIRARMLIKALEETLSSTKELALAEQQKHGRTAEMFGAVAETFETGVRYDYQSCNDIEWVILKENVEHTTEKLKAREKWLRSLTKPENIVDVNGEIITITPPIKSSSTTLKVTIK
jgi:hypothetical protein